MARLIRSSHSPSACVRVQTPLIWTNQSHAGWRGLTEPHAAQPSARAGGPPRLSSSEGPALRLIPLSPRFPLRVPLRVSGNSSVLQVGTKERRLVRKTLAARPVPPRGQSARCPASVCPSGRPPAATQPSASCSENAALFGSSGWF